MSRCDWPLGGERRCGQHLVSADRCAAGHPARQHATVGQPVSARASTDAERAAATVPWDETAQAPSFHGEPLSEYAVRQLAERGYTPSDLERYPQGLLPTTVPDLIEAGIPPDEAARWMPRTAAGKTIVALRELGYSPGDLNAWPARFGGSTIHQLIKAGLGPDDAAAWDERFMVVDITFLHAHGVDPQWANAYPPYVTSAQIRRLYYLGVEPPDAYKLIPHEMSIAAVHEILDEAERFGADNSAR